MIKFNKKIAVSEKFAGLAAQYDELQKKIDEMRTKYLTEEDGLIRQDIQRVCQNLDKQQCALQPAIYREFYRMFDKKCIKVCENNGKEPKWYYIDGAVVRKRAKKEKITYSDINLDGSYYSVTLDNCKCVVYNPSLGTDMRETAFPFGQYMIFSDGYRVTEIPKDEFDRLYKGAITKEEASDICKAVGYGEYVWHVSEELGSSKEYRELVNFVKTAKLRENLAGLKLENLVLEDNRKARVAAAKGKKTKSMVAKAFDLLIEKNNKKIEAKEKEIAKRCGEPEQK